MIVLSIEHTFFSVDFHFTCSSFFFDCSFEIVFRADFTCLHDAFHYQHHRQTAYTSFKSQIKLITSWRFEIKDFAEREKLSHFWTGDHIQCGSLTAYANNIYSMNLKWLRWERKKVLKSVPERLMKPDFVDANFFRLGFCPASAIIANQTFYYRLQQ